MKRVTLIGWYILGFLVVVTLCILLSGCRTQYVTVPEYHTKYMSKIDTFIRNDTVKKDRQIVVRELTPEDSAMLAEYGIRIKDNKRMILFLQKELEREKSQQKETVHDTIIKTDNVRVPYPVEKQLTRWQQMKVDFGEYAFVFVAIALLVFILRKKKDVIMRI